MNRLVSETMGYLTKRLRAATSSLPAESAFRSVFHGPPHRFLDPLLDALELNDGIDVELAGGEQVKVPVLLPVEDADPTIHNPPVNRSGRCDQSHILALRNTPACPRFLALSAPGTQKILSIAQATNEFGVLPANNGASAEIRDWWGDAFIQELVRAAARRHDWRTDSERQQAEHLLQLAVYAADEADHHDAQRTHAWAALSRVLSISEGTTPFPMQWSLACGYPPLATGGIDADLQVLALNGLVQALVEEGFGQCVERLKQAASEEEARALDACHEHLRERCEGPLTLLRCGPFFYAPSNGDLVPEPPEWWNLLTAERLLVLLEEDSPVEGALRVYCTNALVPAAHGIPAVVEDDVKLSVQLPAELPGPATVTVSRASGGKANHQEWVVTPPARAELTDQSPPAHKAPIKYAATAGGLKSGSVKVISLAHWGPGVVLSCKSAKKVSLPKPRGATQGARLECDMELVGEGRHYVDLYLTPGVTMGTGVHAEDTVSGTPIPAILTRTSDSLVGLEVDATTECTLDLSIVAPDGTERPLRVHVTCEDSAPLGCRSEFDRMVSLNRTPTRAVMSVTLDRQVRVADLQSWLLESGVVDRSYLPLVLGTDCRQAWARPQWDHEEGRRISRGSFIHDPRPRAEDFIPPPGFVECRTRLATHIRGPDQHGMVEGADFGTLMQDREFADLVDGYVRSYVKWLEVEPDVAAWVDLLVVCGTEGGGHTLAQKPDAVIVSPLHPLRLGWQCLAQSTLRAAMLAHMPCPAASILDPDAVPDALVLPLRLPNGGIDRVVFLSTDCTSDYWGVLWNGNRLDQLAREDGPAPFTGDFGIELGGVSSGFTAGQVRRALEDVSSLLSAKPVLNVAVSSASGQGSACNEGLVSWVQERFADNGDAAASDLQVGPRGMNVFDERSASARPGDAEIANLAEDTDGAVRWFRELPAGAKPDLGIIAQLETANSSVEPIDFGSPLGVGGLLRHRMRAQLAGGSGAFLSESRMAVAGPPSGDSLADTLMGGIVRLENLSDQRRGYTFTPSVNAISAFLQDKMAAYVAVSSAAVDPACFLGGWLDKAYLWDYELPSYSHRAGDTNGYYLLSQVKVADRDTLGSLLAKLPGCESLPDEALGGVLLEVARRGIPTVRGLSAGHSGASGDLGLFVAARILQDEFRRSGDMASLVPVLGAAGDSAVLSLVIPVDPFQGYLNDLQRALGVEMLLRPDLIVIGVAVSDSTVTIKVTPVEVKYRQGEVMSAASIQDALRQASSLSGLLTHLKDRADTTDLKLWQLAHQHLLLTICDFGFRVYSQQAVIASRPRDWSRFHQRVIGGLLSGEAVLNIDQTGRVIILDASTSSALRDVDEDGFKETLVVCPRDAGLVAAQDPKDFYQYLRQGAGTWGLLPDAVTGAIWVQTPEAAPRAREEGAQGGTHEPASARREPPESTVEPEVSPPAPKSTRPPPEATGSAPVAPEKPDVAAPAGIIVRLGDTVDGIVQRPCYFTPSNTALNQLNIGVVGDLGTGKTQLIKSVVCQMVRGVSQNRGISPRFLIFDYKKDYSATDFVAAVGATVRAPLHLPLNLFDLTSAANSTVPWLDRFRFFADVLDKIYGGVGPVQREVLKGAVRDSYTSCAQFGKQPTIYDVHEKYRAHLKGKVDSVLSIISDMVDMELFVRDAGDAIGIDRFLDGTVVLSLAALGQDDRTRDLLVATMLNMFYEQMLLTPKHPYLGQNPQLRVVDSYLLVDEADNIMRYEFDVLRKILLQGREFGVGTILASQYLRHFKAGGMDYRDPLLTWFVHKVPSVTTQDLASLGLTGNPVTLADRIRELKNHQFMYKTFDVPGEIVQGLPFYKVLAGA